jgi:hypothetical protein
MNLRITPTLITAYTALATVALGLVGYSAISAKSEKKVQAMVIESVANPEPGRIASIAVSSKEKTIMQ